MTPHNDMDIYGGSGPEMPKPWELLVIGILILLWVRT